MKPSLLIIDDEPDFAALVGHIARLEGFHAETLHTADALYQKLEATRPTAITMDLSMPDVDGIQLLRGMAERGVAVPIVVISGMDHRTMDAARRLAADLGLDVVAGLGKPVRAAELRETLRTLHLRPCGSPALRRDGYGALPAPVVDAAHLAAALDEDRIGLVYQPKVNLDDGRPRGVEALARWQCLDGSVVPPDRFVALAEGSGLIDRLTDRVLEKAIAQAGDWRAQGLALDMAVNVSAANLHQMDLPDRIGGLCHFHEVPPFSLTLELTETATSDDPTRMMDVLTRFRILGCKLSIDDFGTGYSSLVQLLRLPFSELKIDRSFIATMDQEDEARVIAKTVVDMARNLKLDVVAEGIETQGARDLLRHYGCRTGQGYLFSRPVAADEVAAQALRPGKAAAQ